MAKKSNREKARETEGREVTGGCAVLNILKRSPTHLLFTSMIVEIEREMVDREMWNYMRESNDLETKTRC
jgi:hypothetical protein